MGLSKEELQFIDTYLKNSEVIYTDVRMELTDHVASAIEQELNENPSETFYEVFKNYMISNKKSLLKSNEEQKIKLQEKIAIRFGKGFLAKEVLFLLALVILTPRLLELNLSETIKFGVNFSLCLLITLYYHIQFYKTKKTSIGSGIGAVVGYTIYLPIYIKNPITLLVLIPVMVLALLLYRKMRKRLSKHWLFVSMALFTLVCGALLILFAKWSEHYLTENILEAYFFFQLIMWYVLFKTLMSYKKELDIKYQGIFS